MVTLYHLRDWYGNVKQERNNKPQSAIQQSVSQEATDAQCGDQGSPARSLEITECKPHGQHSHRYLDLIQRPAMTLSCRIWKAEIESETWRESGSKVKRQKKQGETMIVRDLDLSTELTVEAIFRVFSGEADLTEQLSPHEEQCATLGLPGVGRMSHTFWLRLHINLFGFPAPEMEPESDTATPRATTEESQQTKLGQTNGEKRIQVGGSLTCTLAQCQLGNWFGCSAQLVPFRICR